MNIYIISGTFPELHCGVGDYTFCLCKELKKYNLALSVITTKSPHVKSLEGVRIIQLIESWNFLSLFSLLGFFRKNQADIVHIQYPTQSYKHKAMINIFPIFLKIFLPKIFLIVTIHDIKTAHIFNKLRAIPFLIFSDKIILTVIEEKEYLAKKFPFLQSKLEVIPVGSNIEPLKFSIEERKKIRQKLGVKEDETLLSNFGYILSKKELEDLLCSTKSLNEEGLKVKLIFISDFSPQTNKYHRQLKDLVSSLNLDSLIIWTGYCLQEEVSKYLQSSDICVQLYGDGVSFRRTSFLAALCHGLPIVTSIDKELPDGLNDTENILAVSQGDVKQLTDAIKKIITSEELRRKLCANAKELSRSFSYESIAKKHFMLYQNLLKNR
jgi:glycosyltransferase involved in cell wall biosynthesis